MAAARDLKGEDFQVVAVVGDGAMTCGLPYEALNNAGDSGRDIIVILNDNGMSIAPTSGRSTNTSAPSSRPPSPCGFASGSSI